MRSKIAQFEGDYRFLSNSYMIGFGMSPRGRGMWWRGFLVPTAEHAYQLSKAATLEEAKEIANSLAPMEARRRGRGVELVAGWEHMKLQVMTNVLRIKFQNKQCREKLIATGDSHLEGGNTWGDQIWGVSPVGGEGMNLLGHCLMMVRSEIRSGVW